MTDGPLVSNNLIGILYCAGGIVGSIGIALFLRYLLGYIQDENQEVLILALLAIGTFTVWSWLINAFIHSGFNNVQFAPTGSGRGEWLLWALALTGIIDVVATWKVVRVSDAVEVY